MTPEVSGLWQWVSGVLATVCLAEGAFIWRLSSQISQRPTFHQVREMIQDHERGSCFQKERGSIDARFDRQDEILAKLDRHVDEIRAQVQDILIDTEAQRRVRAQAQESRG